jgi:Phage integrase family
MAALKLPTIGTGLEVERALAPMERRRLLDTADLLLTVGGRSKDRKRYKTGERPQRKGYRPYRNRAIVYTLIETGMRRAAITQVNLDQVDLRRKMLTVVEKGGYTHPYQISREGTQAIQDYLTQERDQDAARWQSPALFLAAATVPQGTGRLMVEVINTVWNAVCRVAQVQGRTPVVSVARSGCAKGAHGMPGLGTFRKRIEADQAFNRLKIPRVAGDQGLPELQCGGGNQRIGKADAVLLAERNGALHNRFGQRHLGKIAQQVGRLLQLGSGLRVAQHLDPGNHGDSRARSDPGGDLG